jgi:hypothetical protein
MLYNSRKRVIPKIRYSTKDALCARRCVFESYNQYSNVVRGVVGQGVFHERVARRLRILHAMYEVNSCLIARHVP